MLFPFIAGLIAGYKVAAGSDKAVEQWSTAFAGQGNAILSLVTRDPEESVYSYAKVHETHPKSSFRQQLREYGACSQEDAATRRILNENDQASHGLMIDKQIVYLADLMLPLIWTY